MKDRIKTRTDDGRPLTMRCDCGKTLHFESRPGADIDCGRCGLEYNNSGQQLAPREQWGEETGETAADYYRGFNDPGHAFEGDL